MRDEKLHEEMIGHAVKAAEGSTAIMSAVTNALHPRNPGGFAAEGFRDALVAVIAGYGRPTPETVEAAKAALAAWRTLDAEAEEHHRKVIHGSAAKKEPEVLLKPDEAGITIERISPHPRAG